MLARVAHAPEDGPAADWGGDAIAPAARAQVGAHANLDAESEGLELGNWSGGDQAPAALVQAAAFAPEWRRYETGDRLPLASAAAKPVRAAANAVNAAAEAGRDDVVPPSSVRAAADMGSWLLQADAFAPNAAFAATLGTPVPGSAPLADAERAIGQIERIGDVPDDVQEATANTPRPPLAPMAAPVSAAAQAPEPGDVPRMQPAEMPRAAMQGDVYLDGARVGRWMERHLSRAASRPQTGIAGFDPVLSPRWPGSLQGE